MISWRIARAMFNRYEAEIRSAWDNGCTIARIGDIEFARRAGYDPQTGLHTHVVVARLRGDQVPSVVVKIETIPPLFREPLPFDGVFAP